LGHHRHRTHVRPGRRGAARGGRRAHRRGWPAFSGVDPRLEQQAALLGDRPWRVLRRVTLPLAAPGLAMALAIAWARAMGAFGAVVIIAYHPYGLPLQIWVTLQETGLASALPFALVLLVVALPLPLAAYIWSARAQARRRA
jgi:molybdate/tungstate transport system permease protein